ncbi:flagellar hook-associated protein FlgL [Acidithiobacillus caldus]|uniref:Flagellar hook-associated protein 3 n=1 Tax=Acidithiobacillus caldus TaxID=33059 RepID=A0A1E7YIM7_9PROT|nr:flagellar hook-associated protein FlgL [Acidithiobacillus caldus]OFC28464.1 flagellar hook-associated protein 3 [Acidithiobacillus caldus]OFC37916.1 flagellar hook-associated protein 3 [Acidithiobacillus caldus]OFC38960.1 flagellar hook-associated protein 3 [Acidithiobacillus caldus]
MSISPISTPVSYLIPTNAILQDQSQLTTLDQQLATGLAVDSPAVNPAAAAQSLQIGQQLSALSLDGTTAGIGQSDLQNLSSTIGSISTLVQSLRQTALAAANATTNGQDRQALADSVQEQLQQLLQLGNSQTPDGNYLLSGSQSNTQPFLDSGSEVTYQGDAGTNTLQIAPGLTIPTSLSGQFLLMDIPTGNGYAVVNASSGNQGTATISVGGVTDPAAAAEMDANHQKYSVTFSVATSGVAQSSYAITNASGTVVGSGVYTPGTSIDVAGSEFTINGNPANGDSFSIDPARQQSLFQTVQSMLTLLSTGVSNGAAGAQYEQGMSNVIANLNQGLTRLLTGQAAVGSSLAQIQAITQVNETESSNDQIAQSSLISANLPAVATQFAQGSASLQAALSAFSAMQNLNLFATLKF